MIRSVCLLCALLITSSKLSAQDKPAGTNSSIEKIVGTWQVSYGDSALGKVSGLATVKEDGGVIVVLRHPQTGKEYKLESKSITKSENTYIVVLEGLSPSADAADANLRSRSEDVQPASDPEYLKPSALPAIQVLPTDSKLSVRLGDFAGEVEIKPRHQPDVNRVELRLALLERSSGSNVDKLEGTWKFYADPFTGRDGAGLGRLGYYSRDPFNLNVATQQGGEEWTRIPWLVADFDALFGKPKPQPAKPVRTP